MRIARLGDPRDRGGDADRAERKVQQEDRPPAEGRRQCSAGQWADRERGADRRAVDGERAGSLARAGECAGQQRKRHSEHRRRANALNGTGNVEHGNAARERARQRRGGEQRQSDDEHASPSKAVGERTHRYHDRRERERIGIDYPLKTTQPGVQIM
jgi:hypothetical protein